MAYVPINSTWKLWSDAGSPISLNNPLTGNTLTYKTCNGLDIIDINVTLVLESILTQSDTINGDSRSWVEQSVKAVSDIPTGENMEVVFRVYRRGDWQNQTAGNVSDEDFIFYADISVTILAGQTVSNISNLNDDIPFYLQYWVQTTPEQTEYQTTWDIYPQQSIPNCNPASPCTLEITGTTTTTPTFQGGTNGSMEILISGGTAPITYSLNGGTPQASNIFTGLGAGSYNVFVEDTDGCYDTTTVVINDGEFRTGDFTVIEPNPFLASENPIITTLSTASNTGIPQNSISTFTFDDGIKNDYKIIFNLNSPTQYSATFTAKDFPNRESYFVTTVLSDRSGTPLGINTIEEVADSFADAVSKDINLSRYYFISVDGDTVTMTAKEQRSSMDLSLSNVDVLDETGSIATTGITLTLVRAGNEPYQGTLVDDYSLYTDIYVGDGSLEYGEELSGGSYENFTTLELPFSLINNIHQFDASNILKTFVFTPKIDLTFTGFTYITSMLRPMYVRYGEKYPLVANENTKKKRSKGETGYKWVINSSLQWESANNMSIYFTGGTFLTNSPNPLDIQRQQTNFLYFILPKDYGQVLTLKGDIDYYDGTVQTGITFIDIASGATNLGGVYALNVSYDSLGLASFENSGNTKVKRVTFAVYAGANKYTEERTYRFEIDEQPRKFGVSFLNDLGGYDTFDFVGIVEDSIDRVNKTYTIPREIQSDGSSPEGFKNLSTYNTKVTKKITVNSGWIDQEHFDWLIELMKSNNIYSYSEEHQNYLNVTGYKYTKSSLDDLFELEINLLITIFENNIVT